MLVRQELEVPPFLFGLLPALFVPIFWVFFDGVLRTLVGPPQGGRWVAFGWGLLTLASAGPVVWHFRQLAGATEHPLLMRALNVWLGLAVAGLLGSLLPGTLR